MQLLSRIIRTGCIAEVVEWGINQEDFRTSEGRGFFLHIVGYWRANATAGSVPGPSMILHQYPTFTLCDDPSMTTSALCAEVRKNRMITASKEYIQEYIQDMDIDPYSAIGRVASRMAELQSLGVRTRDLRFSDAVDDMWQRYQSVKHGYGSTRLLWPWKPINDATLGIQDDDYIVLYGRPKSKKSFVLAEMAANAYNQGKSVLVYTKEMPDWQLFRRVGACIARLPYDELRLGTLDPYSESRFEELYHFVKQQARATDGRHQIVCISGQEAPEGIDSMRWVRSKIEKYRPDIVFIDGLYLMSADVKTGKDHERVASISRAARQTVLETKIPLVATMQANRSAAKHNNAELDEIAFSDAIGQDATAAIRVINEKNLDGPPTAALVFAGSREFQMYGIRINALPCTDFSFHSEMSERDTLKAKEGDNPEATGKGSRPVRSPITKGVDPGAAEKAAMVAGMTEVVRDVR